MQRHRPRATSFRVHQRKSNAHEFAKAVLSSSKLDPKSCKDTDFQYFPQGIQVSRWSSFLAQAMTRFARVLSILWFLLCLYKRIMQSSESTLHFRFQKVNFECVYYNLSLFAAISALVVSFFKFLFKVRKKCTILTKTSKNVHFLKYHSSTFKSRKLRVTSIHLQKQ